MNQDDIFEELMKSDNHEFDVFLNTLQEVFETEEKYKHITRRKEELSCEMK